MAFRDTAGERRYPLPALAGRHQIDNAGTAIACLQIFEPVRRRRSGNRARSARSALAGAAAATGPRGRSPRRCRRAGKLWLDGAHNASGGEALALMAADWAKASDKLPLYLICGSLKHARSAGSAAAPGALCRGSAHGDRARRPQDAAGGSRRRIGAAGGHRGETPRPMSTQLLLTSSRRPKPGPRADLRIALSRGIGAGGERLSWSRAPPMESPYCHPRESGMTISELGFQLLRIIVKPN